MKPACMPKGLRRSPYMHAARKWQVHVAWNRIHLGEFPVAWLGGSDASAVGPTDTGSNPGLDSRFFLPILRGQYFLLTQLWGTNGCT